MTASSPPTPNDETTAGYVLAVSAQGPREESGGSGVPGTRVPAARWIGDSVVH